MLIEEPTSLSSDRNSTSQNAAKDYEPVTQNALRWLLSQQNSEGFWAGMLESNACMEAEWILCFHILGIKDHPLLPGLVKGLLQRQRDDGAWQIYYQAPSGDINATVETYAALRCSGLSHNHPQIKKAREWIFEHGGLKHTRVFTRFWMALIGEWPWQETPNLPAEIIYFPKWFPFNIYNFACWARATLIPLCVLSQHRTCVPLERGYRLDELFPGGRESYDYSLPQKPGMWTRFFNFTDRLLKRYQGMFTNPPGRRRAITVCCEWIIRHQDADGAWGGIQPPWIYSLMALHTVGYPLSHPVMAKGLSTLFDHWSYERNGGTFIQACESPVWDTLLSVMALLDCDQNAENCVAVKQAVDWVLAQQVLECGDWQQKLPHIRPGGWAFERANVHYPDVDDTAVALIVLARARRRYPDQKRINTAIELGLQWLLAMQCKNGGWGAFDKDNDKEILTKIPFSDFGETIDPPSVDVTAHVLEALGHLGFKRKHPAVASALAYIREEQETDGSWFGRWGVNHIYGTAAVLPALQALGEDMTQGYVKRAAEWIVSKQNKDGGWGETCASYMDDNLRGCGPSTASQTGWAMMSLLAVGYRAYAQSLLRGAVYLASTQNSDGTWDEPYYTGTGFPGYGIGRRNLESNTQKTLLQNAELSKGFMINYNLYRHYFPLMALGRLSASSLQN